MICYMAEVKFHCFTVWKAAFLFNLFSPEKHSFKSLQNRRKDKHKKPLLGSLVKMYIFVYTVHFFSTLKET
jgi:hypothetical protein